MKRKFEIYHEPRIDENGRPVREMIKSFKNEPEARAFYNDQRNIRRYGTMFMFKKDSNGLTLSWDDRKEEWVLA